MRRLALAALLLVSCGKPHGNGALSPKLAEVGARPLTKEESALAAKNGFVISSEEAGSFHLAYTAAFRAHQNVYFTADALLHAWHSSYDALLAMLETHALAPELTAMLDELRTALNKSTAPEETRKDVALYLEVAASLMQGKATSKEAEPLFKQCVDAGGMTEVKLFGADMLIDFSMHKPRGHYTQSELLSRYFRSMMWLGRTEIRFANRKMTGGWELNRRALRAVALFRTLFTPRAERAWHHIDDSTRLLVGPSDSMSLPGWDRASKSVDLEKASDDAIAAAFEKEANQKIGSQLLHADHKELSFVPLGQRYVFDSHVFSAVTYGALKSYRMMPNPLDVAYAVFDNKGAYELLGPDLQNAEYRDALQKMAKSRDAMGPELWEGSVYHQWLTAIASLKPGDGLPEPMKTPMWNRRILNTQLASWAELRHDNLLYAKQSFTAVAMCEYPDAYVDPYPAFYASMAKMADKGIGVAKDLPLNDATRARVTKYFEQLRDVSTKLEAIAVRERKNERLTGDQLDWMNHMVSIDGKHAGCTTVLEAHGWYADLFLDRNDALYHKPIIADVHTQPTDENGNPVGKVLHVGTGRPRMFSVTIPTCVGPREFRGFVSSYAEHTTTNFARLTDEEWAQRIQKQTPDGHYATATPIEVPWLKDIIAEE
jgi:hypothetical protein